MMVNPQKYHCLGCSIERWDNDHISMLKIDQLSIIEFLSENKSAVSECVFFKVRALDLLKKLILIFTVKFEIIIFTDLSICFFVYCLPTKAISHSILIFYTGNKLKDYMQNCYSVRYDSKHDFNRKIVIIVDNMLLVDF